MAFHVAGGSVTMTRAVISADDVRAAHRRREHRLPIPKDALVTPLARDEAARWGIELVHEEGGRRAASTVEPAGRHAPTCDPNDLERVIERVQGQVPGADPAVVREIAERVLERLGSP